MFEQWVGHGCGVARDPLSEAATFQCSSRTECVESLAASGHVLSSAACWTGMTGNVELWVSNALRWTEAFDGARVVVICDFRLSKAQR